MHEDKTTQQQKTALEQRQDLLSHHVRMIARRINHALFVFGSQGGLGKSRTILRTLEGESIDPILINSHCTPLALFKILYDYRQEEIIFFDDVDSMFGSTAHLGLLRSALWGTPNRIVTYSSSRLPDGLPSRFEFTSSVIFAANVIPKSNDAFAAVLTRCDQFELVASNEEVLDLMRSVSANGFRGLTTDDCENVIDFIAENIEDRQLSMRLLTPSLRKYLYAQQESLDWRTLIKSQLKSLGKRKEIAKRIENQSKDRQALADALQQHPDSASDQQTYWCQATGKSRASFFRTLSRYRNES